MAREGANDTVQQIKDRLSIVEVITPYVKLTRAGKYYKGLSPFGKEKTASFYVSPDRGSYYCFSTSQGGDHFTFIEKMEGVDFKGALTILADKAGVQIQTLDPRDQQRSSERDRLREAMSAAEQFFAQNLATSSDAMTYAKERGLTEDTITQWRVGFAPAGWRGLLEALTANGYTTKELVAAGLIKEADEKPGTWYDRFRNRLIFPIRDAAGRTVAFTGRALSPDDSAKYLNSPETELFKKSEVLFGMDRAKDAIRGRGFALLVEGQFDLLLLHQAGFTNTIALSGTALSMQHLSLIKRYADNLMLALDADRAGLAASAKNAHAALTAGMRVKAVRLPQGKDPADMVLEDGGKAFTELVKGSQSIIEFFLSILSASGSDEFKLLRQVEEIILPLVVAVKSPLERDRYIEIISRTLGIATGTIREALPRNQESRNEHSRSEQSYGSYQQGNTRYQNSESTYKQSYNPRKNIPSGPSPDMSGLENHRGVLLAAVKAYPESGLAERLKIRYCEITNAPEFPIEALADLDERLLFRAEELFGDAPSDEAGDELIKIFGRTFLEDARRQANIELRKAEAQGDHRAAETALVHIKELSMRILAL